MFKIILHAVDESFFHGNSGEGDKKQKRSGSERFPELRRREGTGNDVKKWQQKLEEATKRYATMLQAYKQVKTRAESAAKWRDYTQNLLNELMRTVHACELADAVDTTGDPSATLDNVLEGVRQLRRQMLDFLCDLDLLETITPDAGDKFDLAKCTLARDNAPALDAKDLDGAVVTELVEPGLAYNETIVKQAIVRAVVPAEMSNTK